MTKDFIDAAKTNEPIALITKGTRLTPADPGANFTEALVKSKSIETAGRAKGKAVFATFYPRDVDRMRTFVEVAKAVDRQFVVQARAAHLLVSLSQDTRIQVPDVLRDPDLLVYDRRFRSEERRVGKECKCRWAAYHYKKKVIQRRLTMVAILRC